MKKCVLVLSLFIAGNSAFAGIYADALARKLVSSTTSEEKAVCVRWMFVAMARHPDLKGMSSVTPAQREQANRAFADSLTRMLTVTCAVEAKEALKYEGNTALEGAFQVFGQIAARELFTSPEVAKGLAELESFTDSKALQKALTDAPPVTAEKK